MSARSFFSKSFFEYFQKDKEQYFNIDVIYHCYSFLDLCNNDFDFLFFVECNNPNHLYIFFSKKMVKTFKKKNKNIGRIADSILYYILIIEIESLSNPSYLREQYFKKIDEICIRQAAVLYYIFKGG